MTEESEKLEKEVKQSWALKYILLTVAISILTGISGYGLKYIFERKKRKGSFQFMKAKRVIC